MEIFDEDKKIYNVALVNEIGKETLLTTLVVFKNGVDSVLDKMTKQNIVEYEKLAKIYEKIQIHINLL